MRKLKIQNAEHAKKYNIDGILQVAQNFIELAKAYSDKMEFSGTELEPKYFTFRKLPLDFSFCLQLAIDVYNHLKANDIKIVDYNRNFKVKL